jgi:NTP pyrophosphatase (non-canonical NTP hydrolase)
MSFNQYQHLAMRTAKQDGFRANLTHTALGLSGEAGEFSDCIKKHIVYGQSLDQVNAAEELGDLLWYVALGCETLGVSMADIAAQNIDKLRIRFPEKFTNELAFERLDK